LIESGWVVLIQKKVGFADALRGGSRTIYPLTTVEADFSHFLLCGEEIIDSLEADTATNATCGAAQEPLVEQWLICSTLGPKSLRKYALDRKDKGLVPLAAVAALLKSSTLGVAPPVDGLIFAFGPAARSGLPVHVNAFFDAHHGLAWPGLSRIGAFGGVPCTSKGDEEEDNLCSDAPAPKESALEAKEGGEGWKEAYEWNRELFSAVVGFRCPACLLLDKRALSLERFRRS